MTIKKTKYSICFSSFFACCVLILAFVSCSGGNEKKGSEAVQQYDGVTLNVDISGVDCLAILLASDGTINRKGSGNVDTLDKNFFMGLTTKGAFDSLMGSISNDLLAYCNTSQPNCDTVKQTYKVKIAFGNSNTSCEIEHCVNGTINDLPKPIKAFIEKAIVVTDSWYQSQRKLLNKQAR